MCKWDDCLEFDAYIMSKTAHKIYELDGEVPETDIIYQVVLQTRVVQMGNVSQ